ncbi:MAG: serine hydrolase domain-containing protein [Chloroflexota bacterium]
MTQPTSLPPHIQQSQTEHQIPGTCIGILHNNQTIIFPIGITSIENPLDVTEDTLFQIGSNTKTMTATVLMMLAEEGKLDLDAPIRSVLPEFCVQDEMVSATATIRQLVTHSTGWVGDHFIDTGPGADAKAKYVESMVELPQLVPPDFAFSYNNSSFAVAGRVIEVVTGQLYEDAMQELLFEPLGMESTFFDMADVMVRRFVVGHSILPDEPVKVATPWPLSRAMYAAGAVTSTAGDMLTYARFYLDRGKTATGEQLLSESAMEAMWAPQFDTGSSRGAVAYSWFVQEEGGFNSYSHGGATVGQMSAFKIVPEKNFAFVSLTNGSSGGLFNQEVEAWLLEEFCQIKPSEPETYDPGTDTVAELVGRYVRPMADFVLSAEDGQLMGQIIAKQGFPTKEVPPRPPTPLFRIAIIGADTLIALDEPAKGANFQILRTEDGKIGWIRAGMRLHQRESG